MLSNALVALALCACGIALPTRGDLTVSINAPANVDSVANLKVVASVANKGSEDVKVVNIGTILDAKLPTKSFLVSRDGIEAPFTGVKLSLSMETLNEDAYTIIPAGKTVSVEHHIGPLFDFESFGLGAFSIEPVAHLPVVVSGGANGTAPSLQAYQLSVPTVVTTVAKDIAKRSLPEKRSFVNCSSDLTKQLFILSSKSESQLLATVASGYIANNGANALFTSYYKTASTATVTNVFNNVANENSTSRTLNCADPLNLCNGNILAYTITRTTNIYYCSIFYNQVQPNTLCTGNSVASRNLRGGTTLHELTHATSGTTDVGYGCAFDQTLSPSQAVRNADTYNCFAAEVYQATQC